MLMDSSLANEDLLEGFAEFHVEDGVDDGVDEGVDVAQPGGEHEGRYARLALHGQLRADGVHDVAREEWDPADEEDGEDDGQGLGRFPLLLRGGLFPLLPARLVHFVDRESGALLLGLFPATSARGARGGRPHG